MTDGYGKRIWYLGVVAGLKVILDSNFVMKWSTSEFVEISDLPKKR